MDSIALLKTQTADSIAILKSQIPTDTKLSEEEVDAMADNNGYLTEYIETDPIYGNSEAAKITANDIANLSNLSGTNTGDQDISGLATKISLTDSVDKLRSEIPVDTKLSEEEVDAMADNNGYLTEYIETDPIYGNSEAAKITANDIANLSNLSGTNTGDQDLSGLATKIALTDSVDKLRSEIPVDTKLSEEEVDAMADNNGYLTEFTETDPIYGNSEAAKITANDISNLSNLSGTNTGDQDLSGLATKIALTDSVDKLRSEIPVDTKLTETEVDAMADNNGYLTEFTETDPIYGNSEAAKITANDISKLSNLSGTNTGDQDLSGLATKIALTDSVDKLRSEIPVDTKLTETEVDAMADNNGYLTEFTETDPIYGNSEAAKITANDISKLSNLSGTNTGDQDLSGLATKIALTDSVNKLRSEIPVDTKLTETEVDAMVENNGYLKNYTETQTIADAASKGNSVNTQLKNVSNPTDPQDAATKSYVTLRVSYKGDTLYLGPNQWVIIPGISVANGGVAPVYDASGNLYYPIKIGTQTWLDRNLRTTKYEDGTDIANILDNTAWGTATTPAYSWYDNDEAANKEAYGALYNWYATTGGNLCPTGFHTPSQADWNTLIAYISGLGYAGSEGATLKANSGWHLNGNGTDNFKFALHGAGCRYESYGFYYLSAYEIQWTSTATDANNAVTMNVGYDTETITSSSRLKIFGASVRCVKD